QDCNLPVVSQFIRDQPSLGHPEMPRPRDTRHLHREIKASTPGLILTLLLINTDEGWWV
ncbi:Maximins y/H11, partial [Dissostichus eleginoides]